MAKYYRIHCVKYRPVGKKDKNILVCVHQVVKILKIKYQFGVYQALKILVLVVTFALGGVCSRHIPFVNL